MVLFEMKHIKKSFGSLEVLKDISLQVEEGEVLSIIGPSGSGKSTLLRCATGLETPDSGEIVKQGDVGITEFQSFSTLFRIKKYYRCADQSAEEKERRSICAGKSAAETDGTCRQRKCISIPAFRWTAAASFHCACIMHESKDSVF